ncbi:CmpA/NrtA family ABC transporter substrate-binding protein [Albidovulum sediminicola]|uniref:ABC transporter substrate-binding protein n=1 Tax=Albidovulum sediminicola TaxID=2984331 RepID=A0ABT2Z626_9RHOB|nr:CmpA/NrtA family ABC transporter substrate-binding protein [Defluviimonas sp. WL0075]MCV2866599.1 ABC transporter substrate-binding protein [Defluviimonas sp. WL0075]
MSGGETLRAVFLPLVDAAPLIIAAELGFAAEEGIELELQKAPSWSVARDLIALRQVELAHLLAPIPVASQLRLGGNAVPLCAVMVMSVNGTVIGLSNALAGRLRAVGHPFDFADARAAGQALLAVAERPLRIGVPFPFSMHAELVRFWLEAIAPGASGRHLVKTVPPPRMSEAISAGEIDMFCVGEPWGSITVENGTGELLLPGCAIWSFAPEKVLSVREDWATDHPDRVGRAVRALWRAGRWLANPSNHTAASEILARARYLDLPADVVDRALSGRLTISNRGEVRSVPGFVEFHEGAATFPWRSQAAWIGQGLARRTSLPVGPATEAAKAAFRSDIYRRAMAGTGALLPGASEKVEGAVTRETSVASESGALVLCPDGFFDGTVFDPSFAD